MNNKYCATLLQNDQVLFCYQGSNPAKLFVKLLLLAEDYPTSKGQVTNLETAKIVHSCCNSPFE